MKKLYYTIGEVSKITSIEPHILRYWETIFDELNPAKSKAGKRTYTEDDINVILKLRHLIQEKKYSTAGAKKVLEQEQDGQQQEEDSFDMPVNLQRDLQEIRHFLKQMLDKL